MRNDEYIGKQIGVAAGDIAEGAASVFGLGGALKGTILKLREWWNKITGRNDSWNITTTEELISKINQLTSKAIQLGDEKISQLQSMLQNMPIDKSPTLKRALQANAAKLGSQLRQARREQTARNFARDSAMQQAYTLDSAPTFQTGDRAKQILTNLENQVETTASGGERK